MTVGITPVGVKDMLARRQVAAAVNDAVAKQSIEIASASGDKASSMAFVPVIEDGNV